MVTWKRFAVAEPKLAHVGRALLFQFDVGLAFLATVREDGAPRLHPVCPVLSNDRLFVLVTPASPKRRDLLRDGRFALQSFPQPKAGSDEFYISGKADLVDDQAARRCASRRQAHGGCGRDRVRAVDRPRHAHPVGARAHAADALGAHQVAGAAVRSRRL